MSTPMIYRPRGHDMLWGATPGLAVLAIVLGAARALPRTIAAQLLLPLCVALAAFVIAGGMPWLTSGHAPIAPAVTAWTSAAWVVVAWALIVVGLAALLRAIRDSGQPDHR